MKIDVDNLKGFPVGWGMAAAAKPCDSCKSSVALLFCRADSAFLCVGCDSKIHGANKLASRHERVWLCEVCEQAPAAVTCKADAAALCVNCDADIHSANPLARRHDRVPVEPFYDSAESIVKSSSSSSSAAASAANNTAIAAVNFLVPTKIDEDDDAGHDLNCLRHEEAEVASWILPNPPSNPKLATGEMFYSDFDHLLEFDYTNSIDLNFKQQQQQQQQHSNHGSDSVVPVQLNKTPSSAAQAHHHSLVETCFDIDFCKSKLTAFNYTTAPSLSHSFSSSSLDVGVVPDGSVMSDISFGKKINNSTSTIGVDFGGGGTLLPTQPSIGLDREARVLRYREKRKNRKFEKTIRYASRKAYAETRPRIKGRFAKRTDNEIENENEVNHMFNMKSNDDHHHNFMVDNGYGVVPSF